MNIALAAAAFIIGTFTGLWKSAELKKRALLISQLRQLTADISVSIRYTAPTLDELADNCTGVFGTLLCEARQGSLDIKKAWKQAAKRLSELPYIEAAEAEIIQKLANELGASDTEGQLSMLAMCEEKLKNISLEAEECVKTKGKLLRSVGALLGAGAAVLIV